MKRIAILAALVAGIVSLHSCSMAENLVKAAGRTVGSAGNALR